MSWFKPIAIAMIFACTPACSRPQKASAPADQSGQPTLTVDAETILSEYQKNVLAADAKYRGKSVIVKGRFARVGRGLVGDPYVQLGSGAAEEVGVTCYLTKAAEAEAAKLKEGDMIAMRGICQGLQGGVLLRFFDCEFVK